MEHHPSRWGTARKDTLLHSHHAFNTHNKPITHTQ